MTDEEILALPVNPLNAVHKPMVRVTAPDHVQVTMLRQTATLFVLLVDRTRWLNRDAAKANAASRASA